ncbi:hypothetical protein [uncultured Microbulbifer sp.]|uniref:hypothetical protein n=1 Tax=uncultured Microbulbifer sp. TaxID=348147 RepID=UPI00262AC4C2|nr:hypothetical protein [uncultured Microbulbifer sp.]
MILRTRQNGNKNGRQIHKEKTLLVLDWLLEFGFSSYELLARVLESPAAANQSRFFNTLVRDSLVQVFSNVHTAHCRLVHLRRGGVDFLAGCGRDVSRARTRTGWMGYYSTILHDLGVQNCVLNRREQYQQVRYEWHLRWKGNRPDAILYSSEGDYWSALEYERSRKSRLRVFESFLSNWKHIQEKRFAGVVYTFQRKPDMAIYQQQFSEMEWPIPKRGGDKKLRDSGRVLSGERLEKIKKRFVLRFEPFWLTRGEREFEHLALVTTTKN